jgi:serine phosphatase RsbU (regulator of sigma subunit)
MSPASARSDGCERAVRRLRALVAQQRGELDKLRSQAAERSVFDVARGIIIQQFGCSPDEAKGQLERLAVRAGVSASEFAAQITKQASVTKQASSVPEPPAGWYERSLAAAREQLAHTEERAAEEHYLAVRLQQAITPRSAEPLAAAGLDIAARHRPSGQGRLVSGDWYDIVPLPGRETLLVVGDVAGHGLDGVTGMVAMRNGLRALAATGAGPATLLSWLNAAAWQFSPGVTGTVICGQFDPETKSLNWARAGHLPPVLVRDGQPRILEPPPGVMLGADSDIAPEGATTSLQSGDTLLFFTDGLIERRDQSIDEALDALLHTARHPAANIGQYADDLINQASSDTDDDACLLAVRVR